MMPHCRGLLPPVSDHRLGMMPISTSTLLTYLLLIGSAYAQVGAPNCTDSTFAWVVHAPMAHHLEVLSACADFTFPSLQPGNHYTGPSGPDNGDLCKCNTVVYNLVSACGACQGGTQIPYSIWSSNCTAKASPRTFPGSVPAGTRVPKWAYIDSSIGDNWNISAAQLLGDFPEVTGTVSISTLTPSTSGSASLSTSTLAPTSQSSSNAGAIAGGIVGGVVGSAYSSPYLNSRVQGSKKEQPTAPPHGRSSTQILRHKVYLPSTNQHLGSTGRLQLSNCSYSGLPEV
ncbi:hypothetical protein H4582DRAFT_1903720 [Lactarius indigo]|nr:hypothetical protein H4582DRAFT_1903720 [Lactarius indigo]